MNKSQLVSNLKDKYPYLSQEQVSELVELALKKITDELANNKRIEIRGFGSFSIKEKNVQSKFYDSVEKEIKFVKKKNVYFKIGKEFFEKINN